MTREEMWEEFENQLKREVHTPITMSYYDSVRLAELGIAETVAKWKERLEKEYCENYICEQRVIDTIRNYLVSKVDNEPMQKACQLLIKVLEQESCEDCISRQAVIKILNTMDRYVSEELTLCDTNKKFPANEVFVVDDVYEEIVEQLPPVTPIEPTTEWIPVSERLPEEDGRYLGCIKNGPYKYIMCVAYIHRDKTWYPDDECASNNVIAWMPLPGPYREVTE